MENPNETSQDRAKNQAGNPFEQFGEHMADWGETFGEQMTAWGREFGRQMEAWGREFESRMEVWSAEFAPRMETWSEELARKMEKMGQRVAGWFDEHTAPETDVRDLREERLAILRMVQEGKISVAEAEGLLRSLGK
ncbi:MAG: SHOCT-like domain-containing protein [Chloroflexota bacterium]